MHSIFRFLIRKVVLLIFFSFMKKQVHIIKTTFLVNISLKTITISQSKSQTSNSDNLFIGDSLAVTVIVGVGGLCQKFPKRKLGTLDSVQICSAGTGSQILIGMKLQFQTHVVLFAVFNNSRDMACLQSLKKLQLNISLCHHYVSKTILNIAVFPPRNLYIYLQ